MFIDVLGQHRSILTYVGPMVVIIHVVSCDIHSIIVTTQVVTFHYLSITYLSPILMERTHKRKRSLQDSTVNLSKMRMALNRLESLKEELYGIEETEEELQTITDHVLALENILKGANRTCFLFFLSYVSGVGSRFDFHINKLLCDFRYAPAHHRSQPCRRPRKRRLSSG